MFLKTILSLAIISSTTANTAFAKVSTSKLETKRLMLKGIGNWEQEFIGHLNFTLMDDPIYSSQYVEMKNMEAELLRVQGILKDKQAQLDSVVKNKQAKAVELDNLNKSLAEKQKLRSDSDKELKLKNTEILALDNEMIAQENLIKGKQIEIPLLQQDQQEKLSKLNSAISSVNAKQVAYDQAMSTCQTQNPSADCTEDPAVIVSKYHLDKATDAKNQAQNQFSLADDRLKVALKAVDDANTLIASDKIKKATAEKRVIELANLITKLDTEIPTIIATAKDLSDTIKDMANIELGLIDDVKRIQSIVTLQGSQFLTNKNNFEKLQKDLIDQILVANHAGYQKAVSDGSQEGIEIANTIGGTEGSNQGTLAGSKKGEADGRARDFKIGQQQGEGDGARDGKVAGVKAGETEGKQSGNETAGKKEGEVSGINKANQSDANSVGQNQGNLAGVQRAIQTGSIEGKKQGEQKAISDNEDDLLSSSVINGQFAGTFAGNIPQFPGVTNRYYNETLNNPRKILRDAHVAGYRIGYVSSAEKIYYDQYLAIFDQAYNLAFKTSFDQTFSIRYEDAIRAGRGQQYTAAYDREFKLSHSQAFKQSFDQAIASPDRSGSIFVNAFKISEQDSFSKKYEEIRGKAYSQSEGIAFNQNISTQTEKFKNERVAQVNKIYQNFPVLKFNNASIDDAGIRSVGTLDGFFMPAEDIIHNIAITNFGAVTANGVKVILKDGSNFTLPNIPAKSIVTIKGIAKEKIASTSTIGSSLQTNLSTKFSLASSEKSIQGRHFADATNGLLNANDTKNIKVDFPITISELRLATALILNQEVSIKTSLINKSQKDFSNIKLELDTNLGRNIIAKEFAEIGLLDQTVSKTDASLKVTNPDQIFETVTLNLNVTVNGVTIGKLENIKADFVKVPFKNIEGAPVVVVNSSDKRSRETFKDVASEFGGLDQLSVLDLNAFTENQSILDTKLSGKDVFIVTETDNAIYSKLGNLFKTPKVFVTIINTGLGTDSMILSLKNSLPFSGSIVDIKIDGEKLLVYSTFPKLVSGVTQKVSAISVSIKDLDLVKKISGLMKMSDDKLLEEISKKINKDEFLNRNENQIKLTKILGLRVLEDVIQVNAGFMNANSRSDRKDWKKMFKEDQELLVNKLKNQLEKGATSEEKIAASLVSVPTNLMIEELMEQANAIEKKIKKAAIASTSENSNLAKANFKKIVGDKKLFEKVTNIASSFFPRN